MKRAATMAVCAALSTFASADFITGFEASQGYTGSASGTPLTGQQGWTLPAGVDHNVYTYAGNAPGFVNNPGGGGDQFAGGVSQGGTLLSRGQHTHDWGARDIWTVAFDFAGKYNGTLPSAQNLGSFSLQDSVTARFFQSLYVWEDVNTATSIDANYIYFDAAGVQNGTSGLTPGAAWNGLLPNHWYRSSTTFQWSTNRILSISITDLHTNTTSTMNPTDWYLHGGAAPTRPLPTAFRFFAGGAAGNAMGWDNLTVVPEPASIIALGVGGLALLRRRRR